MNLSQFFAGFLSHNNKTDFEIMNDKGDKRVQALKCGCVVKKIGTGYVTTIKCNEHQKEFNARNRDRKAANLPLLTM